MTPVDHSHDPRAASWVDGSADHPEFPVQNLPLGVFSPANGSARIGTAIGDWVLDLDALGSESLLPPETIPALGDSALNMLFSKPQPLRLALRHAIFELLTDARAKNQLGRHLYAAESVTMHRPARVGDYTDFYVGIHHATNIGRQFRPDNPLLPNYKHVPIGYHGRASSIRVSGTPVIRPSGQRKAPDADTPDFGPSQRLDYELELGIWVGEGNALGEPVPISDAPAHIAGLCLLNDWSARDLQAWEYQPLGPFLAKNFLTSVSPWVITAEALAPFRIAQSPRPDGDPQPLPYLWDSADQSSGALALRLEAFIQTAAMRSADLAPQRLSSGPASNMYWTIAQMIAHHTSGGCNLMPGDLLGSGTISGPDRDSAGSLIEIARGGAEPLTLASGEVRAFLEDGDELILTAHAEAPGYRTIGFGRCSGIVGSTL